MSNGPLSDIVVRLRLLYDRQRRRNSADWSGHLAQDAIQEIEALREKLDAAREQYGKLLKAYRELKPQSDTEAA